MSKLITMLLLVTLILGAGIYIFNGGGGIKQTVTNGHTSVTTKVRSFDYITN